MAMFEMREISGEVNAGKEYSKTNLERSSPMTWACRVMYLLALYLYNTHQHLTGTTLGLSGGQDRTPTRPSDQYHNLTNGQYGFRNYSSIILLIVEFVPPSS